MLAPVLLGLPVAGGPSDVRQLGTAAALAVAMHPAAMAMATTLIAMIVYEGVGLRLLRRSRLDVHRAWSTVLLTSGAVTLFT